MPGLWARSPAGGAWEATTHWCFFPFLPLSLKVNKENLKKKKKELYGQWEAQVIYTPRSSLSRAFFTQNPLDTNSIMVWQLENLLTIISKWNADGLWLTNQDHESPLPVCDEAAKKAIKWLTLLQLCGVTFFNITPNVTQSISSSFSLAIFSLSWDSLISFRPVIFLFISVEDTRGRLGQETSNCN